MKKLISISIFLLICLVFSILGYSQTHPDEHHKLIIFNSPSCHTCIEVKNEIIPGIEKELAGKVRTEYRDITDIENYKLLLSLKEKYGSKIENAWPVFYFRGHFLNGRGNIKKALRVLISQSLSKKPEGKQGLPSIDLIAYFKTFQPLAVIGAGLADGINPCAFTVIVFFVSFLSLQGYRKES